MKIAISGVTSFTGVWIAHALKAAGFETHGLCAERSAEAYLGLKRARHDHASRAARLHYGTRAEDGSMSAWIEAHAPEVWIHHHHHMENFRSPQYDSAKAAAVGIGPLAELVTALKKTNAKLIIFSGSYFEPGEGARDPGYQPTPYARSKNETWLELRRLCADARLPLKKIVIPNPIGPLENEDRLIPTLLRQSAEGASFSLGAPDSVADNLSVFALARVYVEAARRADGPAIARPSAGGQTNLDLSERTTGALIRDRLHAKPCVIEVPEAKRPRTEFLNAPEEIIPQDWAELWDHYAKYAALYANGLAKS